MSEIIPSNIVDQVRTANDIVDVVSGYLTLKKRGKNYFGCCPFHHEKTPSFSVNPEMQIFHCFGCHAGGNVFTFTMRMENVTFPEAIKLLAQRAGIIIPESEVDSSKAREKEALFFANKFACELYHEQLLNHPEARNALQYLTNRGIDNKAIEEFKLGYSQQGWDGLIKAARAKKLSEEVLQRAGLILPRSSGTGFYDRFRGRVMFPIINLANQVVGFGARRIIDDDSPKYINTPETDIYQKRFILFGLLQCRQEIRTSDCAIVVEGYTDLMSLYRHGIQNAVATSGTALTSDQARLIRRYTTNVVILYDADSAGATASMRGADVLIQNGLNVKISRLPAGHDPDSFVRDQGADAVRALIRNAVPLVDFKIGFMQQSGQFQTPETKSQAIRSLLQSIALVDDRIRKMFMVKELAERFNLDETSLWVEIRRFERQQSDREPKQKKNETPPPVAIPTRVKLAEQSLIEALVLSPGLIKFAMDYLELAEIRHPRIQELVGFLYKVISANEYFSPQDLNRFMDDPELAKILSRVLSQEQVNHDVQKKIVEDCIVIIKKAAISTKIDEVRDRMRVSQQQGEDLVPLIAEFINLRAQLEAIDRREFILEHS